MCNYQVSGAAEESPEESPRAPPPPLQGFSASAWSRATEALICELEQREERAPARQRTWPEQWQGLAAVHSRRSDDGANVGPAAVALPLPLPLALPAIPVISLQQWQHATSSLVATPASLVDSRAFSMGLVPAASAVAPAAPRNQQPRRLPLMPFRGVKREAGQADDGSPGKRRRMEGTALLLMRQIEGELDGAQEQQASAARGRNVEESQRRRMLAAAAKVLLDEMETGSVAAPALSRQPSVRQAPVIKCLSTPAPQCRRPDTILKATSSGAATERTNLARQQSSLSRFLKAESRSVIAAASPACLADQSSMETHFRSFGRVHSDEDAKTSAYHLPSLRQDSQSHTSSSSQEDAIPRCTEKRTWPVIFGVEMKPYL